MRLILSTLLAAAVLTLAGGASAQPQSDGYGPPSQGSLPDGTYECHKLAAGGGLFSMGTLEVRDGQGYLPGLPDGWTILSMTQTNSSGDETLIEVRYRSSDTGAEDVLDCTPG